MSEDADKSVSTSDRETLKVLENIDVVLTVESAVDVMSESASK